MMKKILFGNEQILVEVCLSQLLSSFVLQA